MRRTAWVAHGGTPFAFIFAAIFIFAGWTTRDAGSLWLAGVVTWLWVFAWWLSGWQRVEVS